MASDVVGVLWDRDPVFVSLATNVLGVDSSGDVSAVLSGDVSKMSPEPSSVSVPGGASKRRGVSKPVRRPGVLKPVQVEKASLAPALGMAKRFASRKSSDFFASKPVQNATRYAMQAGRSDRSQRAMGSVRDAKYSGGRVWDKAMGGDTQQKVIGGAMAGAGVVTGVGLYKKGKEFYNTMKPVAYHETPYPGTLRKSESSVDADVEFTKVDSDKRQVFGWASVTHRNGKPVIDRQGDFLELEEVEKSAYDYVVKSRVGGRQHRRSEDGTPFHAADLIESFVVTDDKAKLMGIPQDGPRGWWVGFKVNDDDTWADVKAGRTTGFSVHGKGKRETLEGDFVPQDAVVQA